MNILKLDAPRIGITERGDAGRMLGWVDKVRDHSVDMAILITKCITQPFIDNVIALHRNGFRLIVHCGCTGHGRTVIELGSPDSIIQLRSLNMLILSGFPVDHCVLRIDPIIPNANGLNAMRTVLCQADQIIGLSKLRVRISVIDDYPHVKARFQNAGLSTIYPSRQFYASPEQFRAVAAVCAEFSDVMFETCAEKNLTGPNIKAQGCVSDQDLAICGIVRTKDAYLNPQNRSGCLCLPGKKELLACKHPCNSKCLYCYWKDPETT